MAIIKQEEKLSADVRLEAAKAESETPKKNIMGIERDDKNTRVSFTPDGSMMIVTIPIGHMSRALVHGFVYEMHDIVNTWFAERKKSQIITRDNINNFNFKQGVRKLFGRS